MRKFRRDRLQSLIWLTASSYVVKYFRISSYIRKPFLIYDFATLNFLINEENFFFFLFSVLHREVKSKETTSRRIEKRQIFITWFCVFQVMVAGNGGGGLWWYCIVTAMCENSSMTRTSKLLETMQWKEKCLHWSKKTWICIRIEENRGIFFMECKSSNYGLDFQQSNIHELFKLFKVEAHFSTEHSSRKNCRKFLQHIMFPRSYNLLLSLVIK